MHEKIDLFFTMEEGVDPPVYASEGASGADVKAFIEFPMLLPPGEIRAVPTGLRLEIPPGYEMQIRPRSGLALKHQLTVLNTPGTVDADYRGELKVLLINLGEQPFVVENGMRIAQLVLTPVVQANYIVASDLATTQRGAGGFGHTGLR